MKKLSVFLAVAIVALLTGCATTVQYVPLPDQSVGLENPGMARIYLSRPSSLGAAVGMDVRDNSRLIGTTYAKGFLCWERPSGQMRLTSQAENLESRTVDIKSGYVYYYQQSMRVGTWKARNELVMLDGKEGKKSVDRCKAPKVVIK